MMDTIAEGWASTKVMLRMSDIQTEQEKKEMAYLSQMITPGDTISGPSYQKDFYRRSDGIGEAVADAVGYTKDFAVESTIAGTTAWEIATKNAEVYMLQKMLPMGLAVIQMLLYMLIPLVLVLQAYRVVTVVTLCGAVFALEYMNVPFALSVWADKVFMAEFLDMGTFLNTDNINAQTAVAMMANVTYIAMPVAYMGILTLAGIKISNMAGSSIGGAETSSRSGSTGMRAAAGLAQKMATKK